MKRKTLQDLYDRARTAIENEEEVIYDVAADSGQIVGNIKHMRWFLEEVAREIATSYKTYNHLLTKLDADPGQQHHTPQPGPGL